MSDQRGREDELAFLAAYKAALQLRDRAGMDPSRLVNHQVVSSMLASPEFGELRRETAGDPYAAAMAVIAQGPALRPMLEQAEQAKRAAQAAAGARQAAAEAAAATAALEQAAAQAGDDGTVPPPQRPRRCRGAMDQAGAAQQTAEAAATAAERELTVAAPGYSRRGPRGRGAGAG